MPVVFDFEKPTNDVAGAPVLQARNARCELETKEGAEREHMVGIAAAVGMVATDRDLALMIEQRVEHMQRPLAVAAISLMKNGP